MVVMRKQTLRTVTVASVVLLWGACPGSKKTPAAGAKPEAPQKTGIRKGDVAPNFTLPDDTGTPRSLAGFRGKQPVLLAFYPLDFTGG